MKQSEPHYIYAKIIDPIGPIERGTKYEDPLQDVLDAEDLGGIDGGGTLQDREGKILHIGIDIGLTDLERGIPLVARTLTALGAPAGSTLEYEQDGKRVSLPLGSPAAT
jgi:hypothetical protein